MKLYLLRPIDGNKIWDCWYDKCFGHVIRAESEVLAREIAAMNSLDEGADTWLDESISSCIELDSKGDQEHIISDEKWA